jgi:hypothetical protein
MEHDYKPSASTHRDRYFEPFFKPGTDGCRVVIKCKMQEIRFDQQNARRVHCGLRKVQTKAVPLTSVFVFGNAV